MKQSDLVVTHLNTYDSITPLEALTRYGIMRLAAVVHRLKQKGLCIITDLKEHDDRRYACYRLQPKQQDMFS